MRQIFDIVARASSHFSRELSDAGAIRVQLGRTQGGTPGEWRADSRTVVLDPRRGSPSHLGGTAVFEILNAAAEPKREALDEEVRTGILDRRAEEAGWPPDQFYAMEVERIEWQNGIRHREIMTAAGLSRSSANLFAAEGDFHPFYARQERSGHSHHYAFRYHLLRAQAASEAARREERSAHSPDELVHETYLFCRGVLVHDGPQDGPSTPQTARLPLDEREMRRGEVPQRHLVGQQPTDVVKTRAQFTEGTDKLQPRDGVDVVVSNVV